MPTSDPSQVAGRYSRTPPATLGDSSLSPGPPWARPVLGAVGGQRGDPGSIHFQRALDSGPPARVTQSSRAWLCKVGAELAQCKGLPVPQGKLWGPEEPPAPCSQHTSTSDTLVISMPGSPTLASLSQEASREPGVARGQGMGPAVCWAGPRGLGEARPETTVSEGRGCFGPTQGPASGGGVAPALARLGAWWAVLPRVRVVCRSERVLPWEPGRASSRGYRDQVAQPLGQGVRAGAQSAEVQARLQPRPANQSGTEQQASGGQRAPGTWGLAPLSPPEPREGAPWLLDPEGWLDRVWAPGTPHWAQSGSAQVGGQGLTHCRWALGGTRPRPTPEGKGAGSVRDGCCP